MEFMMKWWKNRETTLIPWNHFIVFILTGASFHVLTMKKKQTNKKKQFVQTEHIRTETNASDSKCSCIYIECIIMCQRAHNTLPHELCQLLDENEATKDEQKR